MSALGAAMSAEWTKVWTTRTVWWALIAAALLMAVGAGQYAVYAQNGDINKDLIESNGLVGAGTIAVMGVALAQFAVIALGTLVMTTEYSSGLIRATLAWVPSRGRVILAKGTVVAAIILVTGTVLGLLGAGLAIPLLGDKGEAEAQTILGQAIAIGGYLALVGVFSMGLGAAVRGPVASLITVFMLMVVIPPILGIPDTAFLNNLNNALPGVAGDHFLLGDTDPYPPGVGLLIVAGWALAALIAGWFVMHRRDA